MATKKKQYTESKNFDASTLQPIVARRVLLQLLQQHPELTRTIAALTKEYMQYPFMDDLAAEIEDAFDRVSVGDIYMNSGRTSHGYREPEEAAGEVLSKPLEPYFKRLEKLFRQNDDVAALTICKAMILALYRVHKSDKFSELEESTEEFFTETADWVARLWRTAGNEQRAATRRFELDRRIPIDFVTSYVPDWDWLLRDD